MNSTGTTEDQVRKREDGPKNRAFCASLWYDLFLDLPLTKADLKNALFTSTPVKIVIILVLAGLLLRFWHIGDISFWLDEVVTNNYAHRSFLEIWDISTRDNNPPTFYWIEHVMLWFGSGETVLRTIPALIGTCTIPVFYLLGREFYNRETGIIAATLLTFSSFHIHYSQEARGFILLLFWFSLALLFYLVAIRTNSCRTWLLFGIFSALACWSHFFGFVMVFPLFITAFVSRYQSWKTVVPDLRPVLQAGAVWFLLSLPMLILTIYAGIYKISRYHTGVVRGVGLITSMVSGELGQNRPVVIFMLLLLVVGLVQLYRNSRHQFFFLATAITLPLMIAVALSFTMVIATRYLICFIPLFFLGISYCIGSVQWRIFTVRFSCIAMLVLVVVSVPALVHYYAQDSKRGEDWKGLSLELQDLAGSGDTILVFPPFYTTPLAYYYHNDTKQTYLYGIENETDLEDRVLQNPDQEFFLIIFGSGPNNPSGHIGQWTTAHAGLVEQHQELYVYRIRPSR